MSWRLNPWVVFIRERFSPLAYLSMTLLFAIANCAFAVHIHQVQVVQAGVQVGIWTEQKVSGEVLFLAFFLALSFFFRLRLFDELRDYDIDLKVNTSRPLVRGLLSIRQMKRMAFGLIVCELLMAGSQGIYPLLVHAVAVGYSCLMYKDFFIGTWLRPHFVINAVSHTLVSAFLGFSLGSLATEAWILDFPPAYFLMGLINWALFNLFEFARKTYASSEERVHVQSYSSIFGLWGAIWLSLSQAVLACVLAQVLLKGSPILWIIAVGLLGMAGFYLGNSNLPRRAQIFRGLGSFFIFYFFLVFALKL